MKSIVISMIATAGLTVAGSAVAAEMPKDAAACAACHKIDKKVVGPAWNDVAKKYKGDAGAVDKIVANITKGGSFGWKLGSMPPKGGTSKSPAELKKLAEFIVGLE